MVVIIVIAIAIIIIIIIIIININIIHVIDSTIYVVCREWGEGMPTLCVRRLMLI